MPRPFRTPWVPYIPILGALFCIGQMAALPVDTWLRLLVWMYLGFLIYFIYSIRRSVIGLRTGRYLFRTREGALVAGVFSGYARLFSINPNDIFLIIGISDSFCAMFNIRSFHTP
ncbi:MAG: amino acid permease C-terminal domain-containing protein [Lentisphaerota bacterium]